MDIKNLCAVVTGGASGLGSAITLEDKIEILPGTCTRGKCRRFAPQNDMQRVLHNFILALPANVGQR